MKKFTSNKILLRIIGLLLFVMLWQILSMIIGEDTFIFPGPTTSIKQAIDMLSNSYVYKCIYQTMTRMIFGVLVAFVLAFILGIIAGNSYKFEELLSPTMTIFKSVPTASLVYLFLVVLGARLTPMFIVILISLPILYESILAGIKNTPVQILEASKLDGCDYLSENFYIRIPLAMSYIVVGLASTFALSIKIEIMAEVITGYTRLGLGSAILAAQRSDPTNMVPVFGYSLITVMIMLVFDFIASKVSEIS